MAHPWKLKNGALSRQLEIAIKDNIPLLLLRKISKAKLKTIIQNPTSTGKRNIRVTLLLKRRAVFALNMKTKFNK